MQPRSLLPLAFLVACSGAPEPGAEAPPSTPAAAAPTPQAQVHMKSHFLKAYEAKDAVVAGRFEEARAPMDWLATHGQPDAPATWGPYVEQMRAVARVGAGATDLIGAGAAVAGLAEACGSCHVGLEAGALFQVGEAPPEVQGDTRAHMARHMWAADRLWEGLVGPSEAAWGAGAAVLGGDVALFSEAHGALPEGVQDLADEVHALGVRARSAATPQARGEVYAELLLTCAACHSTVGEGPRRGAGAP